MARERVVNFRELIGWIRAIALSIGANPSTMTIRQAQDIARVNTNINTFEQYLGLK